MGFIEVWVLINLFLKLTEKVEYTWVQVFKPMIIGYPILMTIGFIFARIVIKILQTI